MKPFKVILLTLMLLIISISLVAVKKATTSTVVGSINGKKILYGEFSKMLDNYKSFQVNKGVKLDKEKTAELNNQLWEELIARQIYDKAIVQKGLTPTTAELEKRAITNPPQQVKAIPALQTNGKFDAAKYKMALEKDAKFKTDVIQVIAESYKYEKLFRSIKSSAKIKPDSVKDAYYKENNKVSAQIIYFNPAKVKNVTVPDSEMVRYFNTNIEKYKRDPARKYRYVKINHVLDKADSLASTTLVDSLYNALLKGADFATLAKQYSKDPGSAANGGDLGYFGKGRMIPDFEQAAFSTPVGTIHAPIKTTYGYHIIKVIDKKTEDGAEQVKASHILIRTEARPEASRQVKIDANALYDKVKNVGLTEAIKGTNYQLMETPEFYENARFIQGMGSFENLVKFAFSNKVGSLAELVSSPQNEFFIAEISDSMGVHYDSFDKAKPQVLSILEREKKSMIAKLAAAEFIKTVEPDSLITKAKAADWDVVEGKDLTVDGFIPQAGKVEGFIPAMLNLEKGQHTGVIESKDAAFIGIVTDRVKVDPAKWEKQKSKILAAALDKAQTDRLNSWYYEKRSKLDIKDFRADYFDLPAPAQRQIRLQ